jgi:hypothetical protein
MQCTMKFTKEQVKQIIKEEIEKYIFEQEPPPSLSFEDEDFKEPTEGEKTLQSLSLEPDDQERFEDWQDKEFKIFEKYYKSMVSDFQTDNIEPLGNETIRKEYIDELSKNPPPIPTSELSAITDGGTFEEWYKGYVEEKVDQAEKIATAFIRRTYFPEVAKGDTPKKRRSAPPQKKPKGYVPPLRSPEETRQSGPTGTQYL